MLVNYTESFQVFALTIHLQNCEMAKIIASKIIEDSNKVVKTRILLKLLLSYYRRHLVHNKLLRIIILLLLLF